MKGDNKIIESYTGVAKNNRASRMPATLDWLQSATGLFLALFMIAHMFFVSSILISDKAMYTITKMFELDFIIDGGCPLVVTIIGIVVFAVFVLHAFLAMRKFPIIVSFCDSKRIKICFDTAIRQIGGFRLARDLRCSF